MKKIIQCFVSDNRLAKLYSSIFALALLVSVGLSSHAYAYTTINSQLDLGESNADVTSLQTFFADNVTIYPERRVTGYFGGLTKAAVMRFQALYGFDQVGRVGPVTRDKINTIINSGGWTMSTTDTSGPAFSNIYQSQTSASLSFNFNTDEVTTARIVYSTNPLMFNEGDINSLGFSPIGGLSTYSTSGSNRSHSVTLTNLQPNTFYYYTIIATDATGNVSVWGPNNTVRTNVQ